MRTFFVLFIILFLFSNIKAQVANKIDKLDVNQLRLPKETASKATYIDATGQVKSSTTSNTELGYLSGLTENISTSLSNKENTITPGTSSQYFRGDKTFQTLDKSAVGLGNVDNTSDANKPISSATQTALNAKANDSDVVKLTGNQSISGVKTLTGKLVASSTLNASIPCPVMTQAQRDLFSASQGDCVYNTTSLQLNIYDGSVWKSAGGSGGISMWITGTVYAVNDVVIQSDKIYRALIAHTAGTFATDLAAGRWVEVSASPSTPYSLASGGTNKALTAVNGGIVWVDADSFEILSSGTSGQILQSNGASSPSWVNKSVSAKSENNASVIAEELQVQNNLLTQVDTNKHLIESGNSNILVNPSFEHATFSTGWVNSVGTFTAESSILVHGKKSAKLVLSAQTMSLTQSSTLYQAQLSAGLIGIASAKIKSDVALKLCSIQAGIVSTTNCVNIPNTNSWGLYSVNFNLGATSNGISIASTGAVTGTVYIDDSYVGVSDVSTSSCSSTLNCTDTFSAKISSSGVVSDENVIDFINGNCTNPSSGNFTCTFGTAVFSVTPNCSITPIDNQVSHWEARIVSAGSTSTSLQYQTGSSTGSGSFLASNGVRIICQKQGLDYIGRTMQAVASDQSVRSIGSTGMDIQTVFFGSGSNCATACSTGNCTICTQVGTKITSVSWVSGGNYNINGIDGTKYICNGNGFNPGVAYNTSYQSLASSTSTYTRIIFGSGANAGNTASASVTCIGIP